MAQRQAGESLLSLWIGLLLRWIKQQLRLRLQERRRTLDPLLQDQYAEQIAHHLFQKNSFQISQHIALYLPIAGEVSPIPILKEALSQYKTCYVPVLKGSSLKFAKIDLQSKLIKNRYGILEPTNDPARLLAPQALDLVLVPLVAFDCKGHRLGMGGGYYDTTFAFRRKCTKPRLIGLAYDFQRVSYVPCSMLDVQLDEVITEKRIYQIAN